MIKHVKIISAFIVLCMVFTLVACNSDSGKNTATKTDEASTVTKTEVQETKPEKPVEKLEIPENCNFEEHEFRILGLSNAEYSNIDLVADEILDEPINDAVYERNNKVEQLLNVKISADLLTPSALVAAAKANISTGADNTYDLYLPTMNDAVTLATMGYLQNLYDVPYLDLDKSWWDQNIKDDLSIKDKLYFTTGEISILDDDLCFIIIFNKDTWENLGIKDNPYDLVKKHKWTMDKVLEIIKNVNGDTSGDGKMGVEDKWGFMLNSNNSTIFYQGAGERLVKPDGNGGFKFGLDEPRAIEVAEKVLNFMLDNEFYNTSYMGTTADQLSKFMDGSVLLRATVFSVARQLRSMEMDFGILPNPLYDEDQERYYTSTSSRGYLPGVCIPTTASDLERTGIILETLAYYSHEYLTPAYYDVSINGVIARDEESKEMLDIIFHTKIYDLGYIFNFGNMAFVLREMVYDKSKAIQSKYDSIKGAVEDGIQDVMDRFEF